MEPTEPTWGGTNNETSDGATGLPAPPPRPGYLPSALSVAVTGRILWVGSAAYPLAMIARISVTRIVPRYGEAIRRFFKFVGIVLLSAFGIVAAIAIGRSLNTYQERQQADSAAGWVVGLSLTLVVLYFLVDTLPVLVSRPLTAVAVDTAGPPTALVAWKKEQPAYDLARSLTDAIENHQASFQQYVHNHIVDLRRYEHSDSVNIYGGTGITGISK